MIHLYYGDGKGKTTAALGMAVRAAGSGMRVLLVQFLKPEQSSERSLLRTVENIVLFPCPQKVCFTFEMNQPELAAAKTYYQDFFERAVCPAHQALYDMLILDEVFSLCDCGILKEEALFSFLSGYRGRAELVLTGHTVPARCIALCDYVSHIKKVRHPFDHGAAARRGIEF